MKPLATKIVLVIAVLAGAFAAGRYSVRAPTVQKTVDDHTAADTKTNKQEHKKITIVKDKGGNTVTTITDDTNTVSDKTKSETKDTAVTITPPKTGTLNISALAAFDYTAAFKPVYGASISKEFAGPFTAGAFGLTNGTIGISVGINF